MGDRGQPMNISEYKARETTDVQVHSLKWVTDVSQQIPAAKRPNSFIWNG